jgi:transcriptional regulator with XRE-family HTH domain
LEGDARCPLREAAGSSHAELVQAMTDLSSELRRLLAERGMSLRDLARHVPCDSGNLSKIARGQKRPSPELAARLDEVLGAGGGIAALVPAVAPGALGTDLDLIELARRAEASDLGSGTLELLNAAVDGMCRDYPGADAVALSARAGQHLRYVTRLLGGRVTLAQHRELLVIAGWLSALIACTCYDTGDAMAARTACRMTRQFGSQAAHAVLVAWSFEIAAWFALVEGRYPETVALSEAGLEHAGVTSAGVQLSLQAARGYARMGDTRAGQALQAGRARLDRLPAPEHPQHHFEFDGAKYEFYVATILTWLGSDDAAAEAHAREVVRQCGEAGGWPTRLGTTRLNLGLLAARRGDLDEAISHGTAALRLPRRSAELLPRAGELCRAMADRYPGEHLVDEYGEELAGQRRALLPGAP